MNHNVMLDLHPLVTIHTHAFLIMPIVFKAGNASSSLLTSVLIFSIAFGKWKALLIINRDFLYEDDRLSMWMENNWTEQIYVCICIHARDLKKQ